jgi:hypothetical protein
MGKSWQGLYDLYRFSIDEAYLGCLDKYIMQHAVLKHLVPLIMRLLEATAFLTPHIQPVNITTFLYSSCLSDQS